MTLQMFLRQPLRALSILQISLRFELKMELEHSLFLSLILIFPSEFPIYELKAIIIIKPLRPQSAF